MRRPSRTEVVQRWTLAAALLLVVAVLAWGLVVGDETDPGATTGPTSSDAVVATTTTAVPPTAPPTTRSTGEFLPDTGPPGPVVGVGPLRTYRVEVEAGAGVPVEDFAGSVEAILSDPRGWASADGISLQRLPGPEAEMTVTLATPATVDALCYPLRTDGDVSCAREGRAVINVRRWIEGAAPSGLELGRYREYLISHELGHVLGHHHVPCPGPGVLAPVMLQQTLGIAPCAPNPWPAPDVQAG